MKKAKYILFILLTLMPKIVLAAELEYVACGNAEGIPAPVPQLISICYTLLIIGTPIILIVFSIIALLKAITGGNADAIKKAKDKVIKKFIAAALVFFVAGLVQFVISRAATTDGDKTSAVDCINCMLYNSGCRASTAGDDAYQATTRPPEAEEQVPSSSGNTTLNPSENNSNSIHINSVNKIKYKIYNQSDSTWGNVQYPDGKTISDKGCMITSAAVVASAYDTSVTPLTVFNQYRHSHPSTSIPALSSSSFTCSFGSISSSEIKSNLASGNVVVIKVYGKNNGGSSSFTSSQHYMALIDIDSSSDKIFVGNAYSSSGNGVSGWFSSSKVLTSIQTAEVCIPNQSLIDKYN